MSWTMGCYELHGRLGRGGQGWSAGLLVGVGLWIVQGQHAQSGQNLPVMFPAGEPHCRKGLYWLLHFYWEQMKPVASFTMFRCCQMLSEPRTGDRRITRALLRAQSLGERWIYAKHCLWINLLGSTGSVKVFTWCGSDGHAPLMCWYRTSRCLIWCWM